MDDRIIERRFVRQVGSTSITVALSTAELEIDRFDLLRESSRIGARMGFVSSLKAEIEEERNTLDAKYRRWRAQTVEKVLAGSPKLAEWKVKAKIESQRDFVKIKTEIASCDSDVSWLDGFWRALSKNADALRSMSYADSRDASSAKSIGNEKI